MPRDLPAAFISSLSQKEITPFFAIDIDFDETPLYLWSGYGELYREQTNTTYLGAGQLLNVSSVSETTEIEARGATLSLSGIPSQFLSLALEKPYQGRECKIYLGLIASSDFVLTQASDFLITQGNDFIISETGSQGFIEIFSGELDQMNISENAETATISVTAENVLIKLERPVVRRFTNEYQKTVRFYDKSMEFISSLQDKEIFWGKATPN